MTGTVVRIVKDKGFGFIRPDSEGNGWKRAPGNRRSDDDLFFHRTAIRAEPGFNFDSLEEGTRVEFEVGSGSKGPRAEDITPE